jgi:hypothetical protein
VRIVYHNPGAVLFRQGADLRQQRHVAAHGEHTVGDDQGAAHIRHLLQLFFQVFHAVVVIAKHLAVAQTAAVINTGVVFLVADHVVRAANDGADDAEIGLKARGEGNDFLLAQKLCQFLFQFQMQAQRPVEEAGTGAAGAILLKGLDAGLNDLGVGRQTEIVVGAQHDPALALHDDLHVLTGLKGMKIRVDPHFLIFVGKGKTFAFIEKICHGFHLPVNFCTNI